MCLSIANHRPGDILATGEHLGFKFHVIHNRRGYRCGYVRVPLGHPWHGKGWADLNVEVHGGVTFAEADEPCDKGGADTDWWIGFDCAHGGDAPDPSLPADYRGSGTAFAEAFREFPGQMRPVVRTQEYAEGQCLDLCRQAAEAVTL